MALTLRKQKSRKDQVTELASDYLKLDAVGKAAKGATKAAKGTAVYKATAKTPKTKKIPVFVGAGLAALVAVKVARGRGGEPATA